MRFLERFLVVLAFIVLSSAPAFAASYTWPVTIQQPLTLTNVKVPTDGGVTVVVCTVPSANADNQIGTGKAVVPTPSLTNGYFSYSGTLTIVVSGFKNELGPKSGAQVSCGVYFEAKNFTLSNPLAQSNQTLP